MENYKNNSDELSDYLGNIDLIEKADMLFKHYLLCKKADLEVKLCRKYEEWKRSWWIKKYKEKNKYES